MTTTLTPADAPDAPAPLNVDALIIATRAGLMLALQPLRDEVTQAAQEARDGAPDNSHTARLGGAESAISGLVREIDQTMNRVRRGLNRSHPEARPTR